MNLKKSLLKLNEKFSRLLSLVEEAPAVNNDKMRLAIDKMFPGELEQSDNTKSLYENSLKLKDVFVDDQEFSKVSLNIIKNFESFNRAYYDRLQHIPREFKELSNIAKSFNSKKMRLNKLIASYSDIFSEQANWFALYLFILIKLLVILITYLIESVSDDKMNKVILKNLVDKFIKTVRSVPMKIKASLQNITGNDVDKGLENSVQSFITIFKDVFENSFSLSSENDKFIFGPISLALYVNSSILYYKATGIKPLKEK